MAFSEVREYQYGDDIRDIDWNVTARYVRPYVKVFEEERELTVMLLIDVSGSRDFGSVNVMKKEVITEIAATWLSRRYRTTIRSAWCSSRTRSRSLSRPRKEKKT